MNKLKPRTELASIALERLTHLRFVSGQIENDLKREEAKLADRNRKWPDLPPLSNQEFNDTAMQLLGTALLCQGVDIYNWYCRECLRLALASNRSGVITAFRGQDGSLADSVAKAEKNGLDAGQELMREFSENKYRQDHPIRQAIHIHLGVTQEPEVEVLCRCRNLFVHQNGKDEFGQLAQALQELGSKRATIYPTDYPAGHMPIRLSPEGSLKIDRDVGDWICALLQQQIFGMDQQMVHQHALPTKTPAPLRIRRTGLGC